MGWPKGKSRKAKVEEQRPMATLTVVVDYWSDLPSGRNMREMVDGMTKMGTLVKAELKVNGPVTMDVLEVTG